MKLYGCPFTRTIRVTWALEEAGLPYEYIKVDLAKGETRQPEYLKLNPAGKVPTLVDGDLVLSESAAICNYIGALAPESRLVPSQPKERAIYDKWCFFVMSELEKTVATVSGHSSTLPEKWRVPAVIETAKWEFANVLSVLIEGLGTNEFIAGDHFTAADILLSQTLAWALSRKLPIENEAVLAYRKRMFARPAFQRAKDRETKA